jgi:hypothetical protein
VSWERVAGVQDPPPALLRLAARAKRVYGDPQGAAALYTRLLAARPDDVEARAGMVRSLALTDPAAAEAYDDGADGHVAPAPDPDAIETQTVQRTYRTARTVFAANETAARCVRCEPSSLARMHPCC